MRNRQRSLISRMSHPRVGLALAILCGCPCVQAAPAPAGPRRLEIAIRAFIPQENTASVAIPNQGELTMVRSQPPATLSCFATDQRCFSSDTAATSRLASLIMLQLSKAVTIRSQTYREDPPSKALDCNTGAIVEPTKLSDDHNRSYQAPEFTLASPAVSGVATLHYAASGLKDPNLQWAPPLKIDGTFTIDTVHKTIRFQGSITKYPAYEAYFRYAGGPWRTLFQKAPADEMTGLNMADAIAIDQKVSY
jgi:hypothetical protein